jgi:hypothetical protein
MHTIAVGDRLFRSAGLQPGTRAARSGLSGRERPAGNTAIVTCITRADIPAMAALAADQTRQHPAAEWLVPDPGERRRVLCGWYTILVEQALADGHVDVLTDRTAAAIWLDRTRPLPEPADYRRRLRKACGVHLDAVMLLIDVLDHHRPTLAHLHLAVLATDLPDAAEALLAHRHLRLNRAGAASYALAGTQEHLGLLMDAGYQPAEAIRLPAGPALWPTWRPAADGPTAAPAQAAA